MFHRSCREVKLPHSPRPYNHTLDGLEHLKLSVHFSTCPYDSLTLMTFYSTVTLLAKFLGISTFNPFFTATWYANICIGMTLSNGTRQFNVFGTSTTCSEIFLTSSSPSVTTANMRPLRLCTSCMLEIIL